MRFTVTIDCDNAAFQEANELGRILLDLAARVVSILPSDEQPQVFVLRDSNGNRVGEARLG